MIYAFDIDGTICNDTNGEYRDAQPFLDRINKINKLYDEGHTIVYFTARGTVTGANWNALTRKQLSRWRAKYHYLLFGKPNFDLYIDNKGENADVFFKKEGSDSNRKRRRSRKSDLQKTS